MEIGSVRLNVRDWIVAIGQKEERRAKDGERRIDLGNHHLSFQTRYSIYVGMFESCFLKESFVDLLSPLRPLPPVRLYRVSLFSAHATSLTQQW